MIRNLLFILCIAFVISSCATPYQASSTMGGYSELQLNERLFEVSFRGNGYISGEQVRIYTMLRAAELAIENGYSHFVIMDENAQVASSTAQLTPDRIETRPDGYGGVTSTVRPGSSIPVNKHTAKISVFLIDESEDEENEILPFAIDAKTFWENNKPD